MAKVDIEKPEPIDEWLSLYEQEKNVDIREASQNIFYSAMMYINKHLIMPNYRDLFYPHLEGGEGLVYNPAIICAILEKYINISTGLDKCATLAGFAYLLGLDQGQLSRFETNKVVNDKYILLNYLDRFSNEEDIPSGNILDNNIWLPDIDKTLYKAISNCPIYNIYNTFHVDLSKYYIYLTFSISHIAKRLREAYENGIEGKLLTGKQNPVGLLGVANYRFGWNQGNGNGQTVNIITQRSADEIASLYGITPAQIAQAQQKPDSAPISTADGNTGAGLPDAMPL